MTVKHIVRLKHIMLCRNGTYDVRYLSGSRYPFIDLAISRTRFSSVR